MLHLVPLCVLVCVCVIYREIADGGGLPEPPESLCTNANLQSQTLCVMRREIAGGEAVRATKDASAPLTTIRQCTTNHHTTVHH